MPKNNDAHAKGHINVSPTNVSASFSAKSPAIERGIDKATDKLFGKKK